MNISIISFAIIASLSSSANTPVTGTNIEALKTQVLSKDELVQIISSNQQANISVNEIKVTVPSLTTVNNELMALTFTSTKKKPASTSAKTSLGDDE